MQAAAGEGVASLRGDRCLDGIADEINRLYPCASVAHEVARSIPEKAAARQWATARSVGGNVTEIFAWDHDAQGLRRFEIKSDDQTVASPQVPGGLG